MKTAQQTITNTMEQRYTVPTKPSLSAQMQYHMPIHAMRSFKHVFPFDNHIHMIKLPSSSLSAFFFILQISDRAFSTVHNLPHQLPRSCKQTLLMLRDQRLLDLDQEQARSSDTFRIHELHEPVALLKSIEFDTCPCGDSVFGVFFGVFDFDPVTRGT